MNMEPADRLLFQLLILALIALAAWAVFRPPVNVVVFNLQPRVPVIEIPKGAL